jgi:hypothetical protein
MRIKLHHSYKKAAPGGKSANTVFVYTVTGTKEELEKYEEIQGENFRKDDETGDPLFFTTRCAPNNANLIITQSNRAVVDMSAFDQADSMAKQYGGSLGTELAKLYASQLAGTMGTTARASVPQDEPVGKERDLDGK